MIDAERPSEPMSLAAKRSYNDRDVLEALAAMFHAKCYLCECRLTPGLTEVDHRRPQGTFPEGKFAWNNLFPACERCNKRRKKSIPPTGLASPGDEVEKRLRQKANPVMPDLELRCVFEAVNDKDIQAEDTATELHRLHDPNSSSTYRANLRTKEILSEIADYFLEKVAPLQYKLLNLQQQERAFFGLSELEQEFRRVVSRKAPYTMLIRSLVNSRLHSMFD